MRLWHKDLIDVLPNQQLLGQWRELCCITRNLAINGTPNHLLVNKVLEYPMDHFVTYTQLIYNELCDRGARVNWNNFEKWLPSTIYKPIKKHDLFEDWHNYRYLTQCVYNLEEKFDCGGISQDEWVKIYARFIQLTRVFPTNWYDWTTSF